MRPPKPKIATNYTSRRKAFGQVINQFEGVSFQVAEAVMLPDMARATVRWTHRRRQGIKKFTATKACGKK